MRIDLQNPPRYVKERTPMPSIGYWILLASFIFGVIIAFAA